MPYKEYQTELDDAKWNQFNDKLLILKKKEVFDVRDNINGWQSGLLQQIANL